MLNVYWSFLSFKLLSLSLSNFISVYDWHPLLSIVIIIASWMPSSLRGDATHIEIEIEIEVEFVSLYEWAMACLNWRILYIPVSLMSKLGILNLGYHGILRPGGTLHFIVYNESCHIASWWGVHFAFCPISQGASPFPATFKDGWNLSPTLFICIIIITFRHSVPKEKSLVNRSSTVGRCFSQNVLNKNRFTSFVVMVCVWSLNQIELMELDEKRDHRLCCMIMLIKLNLND